MEIKSELNKEQARLLLRKRRRGSKIAAQATTCPLFLQPLAKPSSQLGDGGATGEGDRMERKLDEE